MQFTLFWRGKSVVEWVKGQGNWGRWVGSDQSTRRTFNKELCISSEILTIKVTLCPCKGINE
jgi:hypothetical protein